MYPYIIEIGSFKLATYGLMVALGYGSAMFYLYKRLGKINLDKDSFWNIMTAIIIGAVLGSKLLYIIISWNDFGYTFGQKIANIFSSFRFGFVFFGGLIGGIVVAITQAKKAKINFLKLADFFAPAAALGHAIGRLGCFFAGCCHGKHTTSWIGVKFTNPQCLVSPSMLGLPVHPTQLYEVISNLILFFVLHIISKKEQKPGFVLGIYICGYSIFRFCIEFFRGDNRGSFLMGLSPSQAISIVSVIICLILYRKIKK